MLHGIGAAPIMFAGDLLLSAGSVLMQASWDCRLDLYAATIERISQRAVEALMPGHGALLLHGADQVIGDAAGQFARLLPPPNMR
jgi:hypothetical protein